MSDTVFSSQTTQTTDSSLLHSFLAQVYGWMSVGLLITFSLGFGISFLYKANPYFADLISIALPFTFIAEIILVIAISAGFKRFNVAVTGILFLVYAIMNGVFFGAIFAVYELDLIILTFLATTITFGVMSAYGYFAKQDLTKWRNIMIMGLVGLLIATFINIFFASSALYWLTTYFGLGLFIVLVAYDTQKLKRIAASGMDSGNLSKFALNGALQLYLDFINLFLYILRILGGKKR